MELRTPKRYRSGKKRRLIGSWRGIRNFFLVLLFAGIGYWVYTHQMQAREAIRDMRGELQGLSDNIATRIPQQPTPTPDVSTELVAANTAYQTGDFSRAIEQYETVVRGAQNEVEPHYRLALLLLITSDLGEDEARVQRAIDIAEKAINADPESPEGWGIKALALLWGERYGEAIGYAQRALELNPNYVQAKAVLAEAYWQLDQDTAAVNVINEAVDYLREVGSAPPETIAIVFRTQGYIAERQLDRERAIEAYEIARNAAPTHSYISLELALSYFGNGQVDEAIALLNKALDSNPRDTSLLFQLGKIYVYQGNGEDAQQIFQRCVEIDPEAASCLSWLGGLQFFAGNYPQAISNLERAIDAGSNDPDDWWQLGRSHANMLRCDLAIPILREGYTRVEGDPAEEEKFARGLRECGAQVTDSTTQTTPNAPTEGTPQDFFTATPES